MGYGIKIEVWGNYALFTRPEMKVERVSYDMITPSAARGLIEAIYFKPAIRWVVDEIYVCSPISFTNIRRNEVVSKISGRKVMSAMQGDKKPIFIVTSDEIQQRASMVLKNVRYVISAHFEMTEKAGKDDTPEKHYNIALRRIRNGQFYHAPCFGCREFPAHFRMYEENIVKTQLQGKRDMGFMLFDMDYSNKRDIKPIFFRAVLEDGVLNLRNCEVFR